MTTEIIIAVLICILSVALCIIIDGKLKTRKQNKKIKRGIVLEEQAAKFLEQKGYTIVSHHKKIRYTLKLNNESHTINLETDYTAQKNGRSFLVEVKSGENTANMFYAPTRRQILEYYCATNYEGYLLVDMNSKKITEIAFPFKKSENVSFGKIAFIFLLGVFILVTSYTFTPYDMYVKAAIGSVIIYKSRSLYIWFTS